MDLYLAYVLDRDTVHCFLALQDTWFVPKNRAYPSVDLLSSSDPAQSASEKPLTSNDLHLIIFNPN
jgi:hypothetical protein